MNLTDSIILTGLLWLVHMAAGMLIAMHTVCLYWSDRKFQDGFAQRSSGYLSPHG